MHIEQLKSHIGDHAKDIRLNLSTVLNEQGSPGLQERQIGYIALACAHALKNIQIVEAITFDAQTFLTPAELDSAKSAASIMAMNNIYYRFTHLVTDKSYQSMPAKLRMNVISNPGVSKVDFEMACLAVSAINGCGMCMDAHERELQKAEVSKESIQSAVRIAAVLNAAATALFIN